MVRPNQIIVEDLLNAIVSIVSKDSSYEYIMMVLKKFVEGHTSEFPFAKHIKIKFDKLTVSEEINSTEPKLIGKFLRVLVKTLFSDLFMLLVVKKLPKGLVRDLECLGVKIEKANEKFREL